MNDINKTKTELIAELKTLHKQFQKLEREIKKSAHEKERFLKTPCTEEALRKNTKKFTAVFDGINDAIAIHNLEGRFLEVNETLCERLGYSRKELLHMTPEDLDTEDNAALVKGRIKLLQQQGSITFESVHVRKNGTTLPVEVNSRIIDYSGTKAVLSVARDITERKQAEEELMDKTRLNKILLDAFPCVALLLRPDTREIIASNEAAAKVGAIAGKQCFATWGQRKNPCPWCLAPSLWATGKPQHLEVEALGIIWDAHWIPVDENLYMHYAFDISERRETANRLEQYRERLSNLASQLALAAENERHHFADELHDITGQNLALAKIKLSELRDLTVNEDTEDIKGRLDDVLKLIDEAVISTRSLTFELSPPILYELGFEATAEWFGEQILKRYNIAFHFEDDRQHKPLTDDMKVLLYLSLRELIVNIAKHAKARNATLSIRRESDKIHISVSDDGTGFDASTTDYEIMKAASFGLFSTRERIERLGGRLNISSQPGQGTTVTMIVPLKE